MSNVKEGKKTEADQDREILLDECKCNKCNNVTFRQDKNHQ